MRDRQAVVPMEICPVPGGQAGEGGHWEVPGEY